MPESVTNEEWTRGLLARLRAVRDARGLHLPEAADATGIAALGKIERGESQNVYLDHVVRLAVLYRIPLVTLVCGWAGDVPEPQDVRLDAVALHHLVRERLRRDRGTMGTPTLAARAGTEHSTLVRWESGEYQRLDLVRLHRLATILEKELADWLTP